MSLQPSLSTFTHILAVLGLLWSCFPSEGKKKQQPTIDVKMVPFKIKTFNNKNYC